MLSILKKGGTNFFEALFKECAIADTSTFQHNNFLDFNRVLKFIFMLSEFAVACFLRIQLFYSFFVFCFFWISQRHPPSPLPSPWTLIPDSATSAMSTPCSCAMKPRTENIAKPDTKLVQLLRPPSSKQFLCHTYVMEVVNERRRN